MKLTEKEYQEIISFFRDNIPNMYNQINLVDELFCEEIDFFISISTRTDGKSFNYIAFFLYLAEKFNIKSLLIGRHYTIRKSLEELVYDIYNSHSYFKDRDLEIFSRRTDDYIAMGLGNNELIAISDLNSASDLKLRSNYLKKFDIIIYDEFLALVEDYAGDEWEKLKTIYQSMDRNHKSDSKYLQIKHPKIFLLGNAVNFDSPILANLDIFERLENFKINTTKKLDNIFIEMRKNENTNKKRNTRAFDINDNDSMNTGEFNFNKYRLATEQIKNDLARNTDKFYLHDKKTFLEIRFNKETFKMIIKVVSFNDKPYFTTTLNHQTKSCHYLSEKFYNNAFIYKHEKSNLIYYENSYTRNYVLNNLVTLNLFYLCRKYLKDNTIEHEIDEKIYLENFKERTINRLIQEMG